MVETDARYRGQLSENVTYDTTQEAVNAACEQVVREAKFMAERTGRKLPSCLATIMLPYVKNYVDPQGGEALAHHDNRVRSWHVHIYFWDVSQGNDGAMLLAENDGGETVRGMSEIAELLIEYKGHRHGEFTEIEKFTPTELSKRLGGMRPAISRGNGQAVTRIFYEVAEKHFMCQVEIQRA